MQLRYALALVMMVAGCRKASPPTPAVTHDAAAAGSAAAATGDGDGAAFVAAPRAALVGHRAPSVGLDLLDGPHVELSQLLGKQPIYLKFWATWCEPCRAQMPHLEATWRAHRDRLAVFAVDVGISDPIENVREFVASHHLEVPVAIDRDGSAAEKLDLNVTPQHVVIDRAGVVRYVGHAVTPELERAIEDVVAEATPGTASPPSPTAAALAPAEPAPGSAPQALALDDGTRLDLATRPRAPLALTFVQVWCDTYIAKTRPAIGAACAAHARAVEAQRKAHPGLAWVIVAHPVWTGPSDLPDYRARLAVTSPIGIDQGSGWFRRFAVHDIYTTVVVDAGGAELGRVSGDGAGLAALVARAEAPPSKTGAAK